MSRLEEYYRLFDMFQGKLTDEQKKILEGLEDQLIAEEILPAISKSVAPVLSTLRRNITLVVDYDTEKGITVKTTRGEVVVKEHTVKKYQIPSTKKTIQVAEAAITPSKEEEKKTEDEREPITRSESIGFKVTLSDGKVIYRKTAKDTMIATLQAIGLEKASQYRSHLFRGLPLVCNQKRKENGHKLQEKVDGWYIFVNMNNNDKIKVLYEIAEEFGMKIKIEKVE
ncbi:MAG: hypothetical protein MJZ24_10935 [Paludibacteraceae bacterium]|nr:hypothetical protein [Paludibacteraceae bacterium]